jgi:hypothetical protein
MVGILRRYVDLEPNRATAIKAMTGGRSVVRLGSRRIIGKSKIFENLPAHSLRGRTSVFERRGRLNERPSPRQREAIQRILLTRFYSMAGILPKDAVESKQFVSVRGNRSTVKENAIAAGLKHDKCGSIDEWAVRFWAGVLEI